MACSYLFAQLVRHKNRRFCAKFATLTERHCIVIPHSRVSNTLKWYIRNWSIRAALFFVHSPLLARFPHILRADWNSPLPCQAAAIFGVCKYVACIYLCDAAVWAMTVRCSAVIIGLTAFGRFTPAHHHRRAWLIIFGVFHLCASHDRAFGYRAQTSANRPTSTQFAGASFGRVSTRTHSYSRCFLRRIFNLLFACFVYDLLPHRGRTILFCLWTGTDGVRLVEMVVKCFWLGRDWVGKSGI